MAKLSVQPGAVIDGFTVGECVHRGGMATLWTATSDDASKQILIKVPRMSEGDDPAAIVSFEMEQMILPRDARGNLDVAGTAQMLRLAERHKVKRSDFLTAYVGHELDDGHDDVDDLDEIWWDPSCVDPDGGEIDILEARDNADETYHTYHHGKCYDPATGKEITAAIDVPTIGIGASAACDAAGPTSWAAAASSTTSRGQYLFPPLYCGRYCAPG